MKLIVRRHAKPETEVTGTEARQVLRSVLHDIGQACLFPVMPHTGVVRRRAVDALKSGRPIWSENDEHGNPTRDATILTMPMKIIGIIKEDGTYEAVGEDDKEEPSPVPNA